MFTFLNVAANQLNRVVLLLADTINSVLQPHLGARRPDLKKQDPTGHNIALEPFSDLCDERDRGVRALRKVGTESRLVSGRSLNPRDS